MIMTTPSERPVLRAALDEIIHVHGLWPVVKALLSRTFRRETRSLYGAGFGDYLRRDIGLPPVEPVIPVPPTIPVHPAQVLLAVLR
jgi:hypothetical protein